MRSLVFQDVCDKKIYVIILGISYDACEGFHGEWQWKKKYFFQVGTMWEICTTSKRFVHYYKGLPEEIETQVTVVNQPRVDPLSKKDKKSQQEEHCNSSCFFVHEILNVISMPWNMANIFECCSYNKLLTWFNFSVFFCLLFIVNERFCILWLFICFWYYGWIIK